MNRRFFLKLFVAAPLAPIVRIPVKRKPKLDLMKLFEQLYAIKRWRETWL